MGREQRSIKMKRRFVVLGDGQTEQYYLSHLKKLKQYNFGIRPSLFCNLSLSQAEEIIDELISGDCDKVIYLTDYDTIVNQRQQNEFKRFKNKYKDNDEVLICESLPSIEYWFLLHYQYTTRPFRDADEVFRELKRIIRGYSKEKVFLEKEKWVADMINNGKQETAMNNAERGFEEKENNPENELFPFTKVQSAIKEFETKMKRI